MFNNSAKTMFFIILIMGTLISISANSWLSAWMGLEINLLAFIPLMKDDKLMSTESSLKYFLTQAMASSVLLFAMILMLQNSMNLKFTNMMEMMIFSSLLLKMGSAPFHFWFPNVMEGLSWLNSLMLMTWQKIAPLMLISYTIIKSFLIISIILSSLIGAVGGFNQTSLRKLMAYSSINHLSWMLISLLNSNILWLIYFLFYSFLSFMMIFLFNMFKISYINQLFSIFYSKNLKFFMFINLLSLGGLPPFLGFFPKLMTIQLLTMNNQLMFMMFMVMMALITLFYYIRLTYSAFLLNYFENNWMTYCLFNKINMKILTLCSFISSFGLFIIFPLYY